MPPCEALCYLDYERGEDGVVVDDDGAAAGEAFDHLDPSQERGPLVDQLRGPPREQ